MKECKFKAKNDYLVLQNNWVKMEDMNSRSSSLGRCNEGTATVGVGLDLE
jgi:hypothetical protein